ncbi:MAG: hypothetical protein ACP5GC_08750 [Thiomonas sp.]
MDKLQQNAKENAISCEFNMFFVNASRLSENSDRETSNFRRGNSAGADRLVVGKSPQFTTLNRHYWQRRRLRPGSMDWSSGFLGAHFQTLSITCNKKSICYRYVVAFQGTCP